MFNGFWTLEVAGIAPGNDQNHEVGLPLELSVKLTQLLEGQICVWFV
jgi:hypothetical protein